MGNVTPKRRRRSRSENEGDEEEEEERYRGFALSRSVSTRFVGHLRRSAHGEPRRVAELAAALDNGLLWPGRGRRRLGGGMQSS